MSVLLAKAVNDLHDETQYLPMYVDDHLVFMAFGDTHKIAAVLGIWINA
jgi:hypothetical protein